MAACSDLWQLAPWIPEALAIFPKTGLQNTNTVMLLLTAVEINSSCEEEGEDSLPRNVHPWLLRGNLHTHLSGCKDNEFENSYNRFDGENMLKSKL